MITLIYSFLCKTHSNGWHLEPFFDFWWKREMRDWSIFAELCPDTALRSLNTLWLLTNPELYI